MGVTSTRDITQKTIAMLTSNGVNIVHNLTENELIHKLPSQVLSYEICIIGNLYIMIWPKLGHGHWPMNLTRERHQLQHFTLPIPTFHYYITLWCETKVWNDTDIMFPNVSLCPEYFYGRNGDNLIKKTCVKFDVTVNFRIYTMHTYLWLFYSGTFPNQLGRILNV